MLFYARDILEEIRYVATEHGPLRINPIYSYAYKSDWMENSVSAIRKAGGDYLRLFNAIDENLMVFCYIFRKYIFHDKKTPGMCADNIEEAGWPF